MWKRGALVSWDDEESEVKERLLPIRGLAMDGGHGPDFLARVSGRATARGCRPLRAVENHYSSGKKLTLEEVEE